jgi:alanine dehydrogenase
VQLRPIQRVMVHSRNAGNREAFARAAAERFGIPVEPAASAEKAMAAADIALVSTNSPTPALFGRWLRAGQAIFGVGRPNEFDDEVYLRATLISVTSKAHELGYYDSSLDQPLIRLGRQESKLDWNSISEFADIVRGKSSVPDLSNSIIVFRDSQGGYGDVALAAWAYEEAKRRGLGQEINTE